MYTVYIHIYIYIQTYIYLFIYLFIFLFIYLYIRRSFPRFDLHVWQTLQKIKFQCLLSGVRRPHIREIHLYLHFGKQKKQKLAEDLAISSIIFPWGLLCLASACGGLQEVGKTGFVVSDFWAPHVNCYVVFWSLVLFCQGVYENHRTSCSWKMEGLTFWLHICTLDTSCWNGT